MMSSAWAIGETYVDVKDMIWKSVYEHNERYGGTLDEWLSNGNWVFMKAYFEYDESRGMSFSSYLQFLLDRRMKDFARKHAKYWLGFETVPCVGDGTAVYQEDSMTLLLKDLSVDAQRVVGFIAETPTDIHLLMEEYSNTRFSFRTKMRSALSEFLKDLGWASDRIMETFEEIKEAL